MREGDAGGVTLAGGAEIGDGGGAEGGVGGEGVEEEVVEEGGEERRGAELVAEVERQRPFQRRVRQYRRVQVARQRRLRLGVAFRLRFYLGPQPRFPLRSGGERRRLHLAGWHRYVVQVFSEVLLRRKIVESGSEMRDVCLCGG